MSLKNREWKEFFIDEVFLSIHRGKRLIEKNRKNGDLPYYSASSSNNGLTDFIDNPLFVENRKIIITTFCDAYFVESDFTASDEITMLSNKLINKYSGLFITRAIVSNKSKYAFGRKAFSERLKRQKILLPVNWQGEPDYEFMEAYMRAKEQEKINAYKNYISKRIKELENVKPVVSLKEKDWAEFEINKIFQIKSGKRLTKADMKKGKKPFIGSTDNNNGITEYVSNTNSSEDYNVLGVNYNGSVVENFYHPYKALFSDDVKRLSFKEVEGNKYLYLFAKTSILKQKSKYQYGYKFNGKRMNRQKIMLPINEKKEPDYEYMENYIKRLELEKIKKYLDYKKRNERKTV